MYLKEVSREDVDWIHLSRDRVYWQALVNMLVDLQAP
jgi:hypothetical protein